MLTTFDSKYILLSTPEISDLKVVSINYVVEAEQCWFWRSELVIMVKSCKIIYEEWGKRFLFPNSRELWHTVFVFTNF